MSSNKSVRFASSKRTRNDDLDQGEPTEKKKPKRYRPNEDELDDIDDWEKGDDEEQDNNLPSERQQLEAKRKRREQRTGENGDAQRTQINSTTSLAADGVQIEPFNMAQEETDGTGYFDGDTYVFRKRNDEDGEPDAWLDSLEADAESEGIKADPGKPSNTQSRISALVRKPVSKKRSPSIDTDELSMHELYGKILPLVSDTETVSQAVRRYGQLLKRKQHKNGVKKSLTTRGTKQGDHKDHSGSNHEEWAKACLDELTTCANALLFKGDVNIYDSRRSHILKALPSQEGATQKPSDQHEKTEKFPPAQWEYMGNQDGKMHGPYSTEEMLNWTQAGYFVGAQSVKIRTIRKEETSVKEDLLADLMDDDDDEASSSNEMKQVKGPWLSSNDVDFKAYL